MQVPTGSVPLYGCVKHTYIPLRAKKPALMHNQIVFLVVILASQPRIGLVFMYVKTIECNKRLPPNYNSDSVLYIHKVTGRLILLLLEQ